MFALPRCDGVDSVPPVSSSSCHSLTASCWVTKLFHRRDWQSHIYILIKFVTHPCSCLEGCHLPCFYVSKCRQSNMLYPKHLTMCERPLSEIDFYINTLVVLHVSHMLPSSNFSVKVVSSQDLSPLCCPSTGERSFCTIYYSAVGK